jgi:putative hydrolase of the HAD superfamily
VTVRAIFFDAGNTLIHMDYDAITAALGRERVAATVDQVRRAEWRARIRLDASFAPGGSTEDPATGDRYLAFLLDELGVRDPDTATALAAWRRGHNPPRGLWTAVEPAAEPALRLARQSGLATGVVSNSNGTIADILETLGLARHLDFVVDSSKVGVEKPDPRIFALALAELRVPAGEAVYVGDLYSVDVLGARAAGLQAVLLDPRGYWGPRDCPRATGIADAVRLALGA